MKESTGSLATPSAGPGMANSEVVPRVGDSGRLSILEASSLSCCKRCLISGQYCVRAYILLLVDWKHLVGI